MTFCFCAPNTKRFFSKKRKNGGKIKQEESALDAMMSHHFPEEPKIFPLFYSMSSIYSVRDKSKQMCSWNIVEFATTIKKHKIPMCLNVLAFGKNEIKFRTSLFSVNEPNI